ncbi:LOG family protein [Methyloligella sp. GL2]|nr:LOG family protein [Methyloligella sp. GL2]
MRPARLALEFSKVDLALKHYGIGSTVVVWGSSRIISPEQAEAELSRASDPDALEAAKLRQHLSAWYREARNFGRIVSERGGALASSGARQNVIATGGGPGIMEAANRGAADAGAPSIGFNIVLPQEQEPNPFSTPELTFQFQYFGLRKMHFAMRANALAVFPGGYGTLDELFQFLTLTQTGKTPKIPIVLVCEKYWRSMVNFEGLRELGVIGRRETALFEIVDSGEEAWEVLVKKGLTPRIPDADI